MKFDKEIKEIFFSSSIFILNHIFKLKVKKISLLPTEISIKTVIPDFVAMVRTQDNKTFIFHMEFQSYNDHSLPQRMLTYRIALQKYNLPIEQVAIYFGKDKLKMSNFINDRRKFSQLYYKFRIVDIKNVRFNLETKNPDIIVLAILSKQKKGIVRKILARLLKLKLPEKELLKYIHKLEILSQLAGLEEEVKKEVKNMPIHVDYTKLWSYKKGLEKGLKKGRLEGKLEGKLEGLLEAIEIDIKLKFGEQALDVMNKIKKIKDISKLKKIKELLSKANSLSEFKEKLDYL